MDELYSTTSSAIVILFPLLLALEHWFSLRRRVRPVLRRLVVNLLFSTLSLVVAVAVVKVTALKMAQWTLDQAFGLLHLVPLPFAVQIVLGFLLMDLSFYYWHRANHFFPILWRFHNVHHIDPDLDVSTSFRFHFGEVFYSVVFRVCQIYLIGATPPIYLAYELAFQSATMFHHSNLRVPIDAERWINLVVVTPRMHGIHHSTIEDETNSNYSVIFRWWDALHGTLRLNVRQADITIGVPAYLRPEDNSLWSLISLPFCRQRKYWQLPSGRESKREPALDLGETNLLLP